MSGIPDYKSFLLPFLHILSDGQPHTLDSLNESLAIAFNLSQKEKDELVKCGRQYRYKNRIITARTF
ncbi:winged helix-turn-helix domain-containing protein [Paenibacillus radicis (ex Xue et al. 2023)]